MSVCGDVVVVGDVAFKSHWSIWHWGVGCDRKFKNGALAHGRAGTVGEDRRKTLGEDGFGKCRVDWTLTALRGPGYHLE
jgi:hypothetical protein